MSVFRFRLIAGRSCFACGVLALGLLAGASVLRAADQFPFDQTLMLDVKPMPPVKRVPILTVDQNGEATIGLWCKTVRARAALTDSAMRIEPGPLPDDLPQYVVDGQCTDERMKADQDTLDALTQVTGWRRQGGAIVLTGAAPLKFRPSSN
jgi:hypothetical protein